MTLGARMTRRDEAAFVGRRPELGFLDSLFVEDPPANVVLVHGPGGIGKSTLLRRVRQRGQEAGWTPLLVEGRDLPPVADALDDALARAHSFERPLILLDTYERMAALGGHLRRSVLPDLPDASIVVIAGRGTPDPGWREGGWENLTVELELGPLSADESRSLLASQGVTDEVRSGELADWARGSPLALTLAASAALRDPDWSPAREGDPPEIVRTLIAQLAGGQVDEVHRDVIGVASIARVVNEDLLHEVLPDIDAAEGLEWLRGRAFAEPLGGGLTLHELVRRAARADLKHRDPERERELRRRIADHLYVRAAAGNTLLTVDLAELVDSDAIRAFYGWEGATRNRIDGLRDADKEQLALLLASVGCESWWEQTRRVVGRGSGQDRDRPRRRRQPVWLLDGGHAGHRAAGGPRRHPAGAPGWPTRPSTCPTETRSSGATRSTSPATPPRASRACSTWSGCCARAWPTRASPTCRSTRATPRAPLFSQALGGQHISELDVDAGDLTFECHVLDYGEGGLLGLQRGFVYMELGLPAPDHVPPPEAEPVTVDPDAVRDALRSLAVPADLARSPLATGRGIEERAASVRTLLEQGAASAFGDADGERLLASVLTRGYLDPAPSHEVAADELNLSRAAYFRRLKQASERLAEYLTGAPPA